MALFKREKRAEEITVSDQLLRAWLSPTAITRKKAMEIPSLAGAIDEIAKTVASIPIKLYKKEGTKVEEIKNDRRVFLLNEETGDTLDANQMKQAIVRDYYLGGGAYVYVDWQGQDVESLRFVEADKVSVVQNFDPIFKSYSLLINGKSFYPEQFIRILRNTEDGAKGLSILDQNARALSVAYNSLLYEESLVKAGGNKKGFIKSAKKLTQEAINNLKEAWQKLYQNNTENVVILNDGLEFQEASNTSVEMQLNENKKTNGEEFRDFLAFDNLGTENGDKAFIKYCINGIMNEIITAINRALLLEKEKGTYYFAADMYELTKGDEEKRYGAYKLAAETGWLQIDEIREMENREPLGIDMVKLGLQDVLYNPHTKEVYNINSNKTTKIEKGGTNWQE